MMNSFSPIIIDDVQSDVMQRTRIDETRFDPAQIWPIVESWWKLQGRTGTPPPIGDITTFRDLVSVMTGSEYAVLSRKAYAARGSRPVYLGGSSGTTGKSKLVMSHILLPNERPTPLDIALIRDMRKSGLAGPGDVFANMFVVTSFSILHHGMNKILEACHATIVPLGALQHNMAEAQIDFLSECGVNALTGTPGTLLQLAHALQATGRSLPIKRILYTGECFGPSKRALVAKVFPEALITGLFGLSETGFIGFETETDGEYRICEDGYFLETDADGRLLVTCLDPHRPVPILRYAAGDRGRLTRSNGAALLNGVERIGLDFNFMGNVIDVASIRSVVCLAINEPNAEIQIVLTSNTAGYDLLTVGIFGVSLPDAVIGYVREALLALPELREAIEKQAGDIQVRTLPLGPPTLTVRQKHQVIVDQRH